jgi:hypothetical protein
MRVRIRSIVALAVCGLAIGTALSGCTGGRLPASRPYAGPLSGAVLSGVTSKVAGGIGSNLMTAPGPAPLLVFGSGRGVTVVEPSTGQVRFRGSGVFSPIDPSRLFSTVESNTATTLTPTEVVTGSVTGRVRIPGRLASRVMSDGGSLVALMAPRAHGSNPWIPSPRAWTEIVIADPSGIRPVQRFRVKGNVEPEAFSADDGSFFLIRYLPAMAPTAYRVSQLELGDGDVYPVLGRNKTWSETMTGTRLRQAPSPTGDGLYTLYSSQPPWYAKGFDQAQAAANGPVAFVHSLNLEYEFAVCVGLPRALWGGNPNDEAIAVSPVGDPVYVVDTARGVVGVMDSGRLKVVRTASVRFGRLGSGPTQAAVSPDGTALFVTRGSRVLRLDLGTMRSAGEMSVGAAVTSLGFSLDGHSMYLADSTGAVVVDVSSGAERGAISLARGSGARPFTFVGAILG